ncbi:MAG: 30S ribosomal protein S14 [Chloroflexi bacterium]|nr:30S ribosomal protein S14 [Chloroflexota bacterium]MDA1239462.1 30S ribosomal protein S14 [Chloroflexota bacterium]MQC47563.1 30S ribosomal protein S14 [Chloroflexota bacterium]
MAKESMVVKNQRRARLQGVHAARRKELVAVLKDPAATDDAKAEAYRRLYKMPRDASATRFRNRCNVTGRPRGFMRQFGVSRIVFRELAREGMLPGVKKASW